jgi:predicted Zn-ribbon and HTH transcriptional regulator
MTNKDDLLDAYIIAYNLVLSEQTRDRDQYRADIERLTKLSDEMGKVISKHQLSCKSCGGTGTIRCGDFMEDCPYCSGDIAVLKAWGTMDKG